jgi:hypothetical protein
MTAGMPIFALMTRRALRSSASRVQTGRLEKIANLAGVERGPFFMGDWIGLAPDGSPLAINNATTEDIYGWDLTNK